jgi:hypothetical protein
MDRETTMNGAHESSSAQALVHDVAGVASSLATMAELQARLFGADFRAARDGVVRACGAWIAALVLLAAALPVALAGCGLWLAEVTGVSAAVGLVTVALLAIAVVAALAAFGWWHFSKQQRAFDRSRRELAENLSAMRQMLSDFAERRAPGSYDD